MSKIELRPHLIKTGLLNFSKNTEVKIYYPGGDNLIGDALALIEQLAEENERLKSVEFTCGFIKPHKVLECPIFDEIVRTKADTARTILSELRKVAFVDATFMGKPNVVTMDDADRIISDILEGNG